MKNFKELQRVADSFEHITVKISQNQIYSV